MDRDRFNENSRIRLTNVMKKEVTKMMEKSLDFAHVACHKDTFQQLRSKILRIGNDCMRALEKEFKYYDIHYTDVGEEIIQFKMLNKRRR